MEVKLELPLTTYILDRRRLGKVVKVITLVAQYIYTVKEIIYGEKYKLYM
jgi:hypothetical protein